MARILNTQDGFETALSLLNEGNLVAVPTETVYGLAADATNADAVAKIYKAKGRPGFNPLIAHVSGLEMAQEFASFNDIALALAEKFWPGPLTLVLPQVPVHPIAENVTAGLETIALRHPNGTMARLSEALGRPLAAPSANTSGKISPTRASHVVEDLGDKLDLILDGDACDVGLESTIVKVTASSTTLLREGGLETKEIEEITGPLNRANADTKIESPGMLLAHYAPHLPVRLNAVEVMENEALLFFGAASASGEPHTALNLSSSSDLNEAAHNLFAMLKQLDNSGAERIAVQHIPNHGLGAAINDRLKRAANGVSER